ncbi:MAG TPA: hypothetical protein VK063_00855, partial [Beutenbergiaceae bacterium]|nr:hypothetical protein [Beutenbergiaceae bacterium]
APDDDELLASTDQPEMDSLTTTAGLVQAAVAEGRLDEHTGLMYRVWGQFNDPRLPEEYRGEAAAHDVAAVSQASRELDELPAEAADGVRPYLLRPTDPRSAFSAGGPDDMGRGGPDDGQGNAGNDGGGARGGGGADDGGGRPDDGGGRPDDGGGRPGEQESGTEDDGVRQQGEAAGDNPDDADPRRCTGEWLTQASDQVPIRVWVCADRGPGTMDPQVALDAVIEIADHVVPEMTAPVPEGMGHLKADLPSDDPHPESDDKIDIYLLDHGWLGPERRGEEMWIDPSDGGVAISAGPFRGASASGYILIGAGVLEDKGVGIDSELARVVVHELFHVLQFAHNDGVFEKWFFEGTATWAERYYLGGDFAEEHRKFLRIMQADDASLVAGEDKHKPYATNLWAMFMEQEAGAESIFTAWRQLGRTTGGYDAVITAVNDHVPFEAKFPEFAMRLLNANPQGNPISTRFVHLDPTFPDNTLPDRAPHDLGDEALILEHSGIPGLGYQFYLIHPGGPEDEVTGVGIRAELEDAGVPAIEALVRDESGRYHRRSVDLGPEGSEFCVGGLLLLVVSNADTDPTAALAGASTVEKVDDLHCEVPAGELVLRMEGSYDDPPTAIPVTHHAQVDWTGSLMVELERIDTSFWIPPLPGQEDDGRRPEDYEGDVRYSGAGSTWSVEGSFTSERCSPHVGCAGYGAEQRFDSDVTLGGQWDEAEHGGFLTAELDEHGLRISANLPVTVTTTVLHPDREPRTRTDVEHWPLTCYAGGYFHFSAGGEDVYATPMSGVDLTGTRTGNGSEFHFDCSQSWQPAIDGANGSTTFTAVGTLTVDD